MDTTLDAQTERKVRQLLWELGFPPHTMGYKQLCIAIPLYGKDREQSLSCNLYPAVAEVFHLRDSRAVERAIRTAITKAWQNQAGWERYFPGHTKPPSNKVFIAAMAEQLL